MRRRGTAIVLASVLIAACSGDRQAPVIEVVSSRPHLVSGGDALVRVIDPDGASPATIRLNGRDITGTFRPQGSSRLGLVSGLADGTNVIEAGATRLEVTNYPATGPMISGPHEQPFICGLGAANVALTGQSLGEPRDEACSAPTRVDYVYRSTAGRFLPWPADARPADIAETTTLDGRTVPFIVRVETGTVNRAIYESALLHDPATPAPDAWTRSPGWNGKLVYTHGGGCQGGWHVQGSETGGVLNAGLLADGFAVTSSSLNVFGNNCNDLLASETHMMVKERFVERYGVPVYTIATGGSGGSYQSHQTADNYPGVFDGIIVTASFPDVVSVTIGTITDARLLHHYFTTVAPGTFTREQQRAVSGFREWANLATLSRAAARIDPVYRASDAAEEQGGEVKDVAALRAARYDPTANPQGFRATVYDHAAAVYGTDPKTGAAGRPLDNVGVQYGLAALNAGAITTSQFLDLNERIGGFDADANHVTARHVADPVAARRARTSGRVLHGGGGLATTPIIDYRSYTDDARAGDIHMIVHQFSTRARLVAANGHADNQVMVLGGRWDFTDAAPDLRTLFRQMDAWLTTLAKDTTSRPAAAKVVAAKPADLQEGCWDNRQPTRRWVAEPLSADGTGTCGDLYRAYRTPRLVAGAPLANDIVKCQLKPVDASAYAVAFTPAEQDRLRRIFPDGVCDWSRPDVYDGYAGTWRSFGPSPVNRVE